MKGTHQNKFGPSFPSSPLKKGNHSFQLWPTLIRMVGRPTSNLLKFTQQGGTKERGKPSFQRHTMFNLYQQMKETNKPTQLKRARRSLSFSINFSHTIPLLCCHGPSTVRERLFFAVTFPQGNLSGIVITISKGNPATLSSSSTLPSFLGREGTLPCGSSRQLARKSATTSLNQSCPMPSMAQHSLLCSYSSQPKEVSLAEQELIHSGQEIDDHLTQLHLLLPKGVDKSARTP